MLTESIAHRDQFSSPRTEFIQDQAVELAPDPGPAALGEPPVRGGAGGAEDRRRLPPGTAGRGHKQDRRQHFAVTVAASATALRTHRRGRDPRWNNSHSPSGTGRPTIAITTASLVIKPIETISQAVVPGVSTGRVQGVTDGGAK